MLSFMEDSEMETIFHVYYTDKKSELYLLDDWGEAGDGTVSKWVQTLKTTGVGDRTANCLPICNFECSNLAWSGKGVISSIILKL